MEESKEHKTYSLTRETLANKFQGLSDYDLEPLKKLQWKHLLLCRLSDSPHAWSSSGPVPGELKKTNATEGASHLVPQYDTLKGYENLRKKLCFTHYWKKENLSQFSQLILLQKCHPIQPQCHKPVIPATQKHKLRGPEVQGQPGQLSKILCQNETIKKLDTKHTSVDLQLYTHHGQKTIEQEKSSQMHRKHDLRSQEPLFKENWFHSAMIKQGHLIKIQDLFSPGPDISKEPHIVILHGAAGIGKSTLARQVRGAWERDQLYRGRFQYVFYLSCRELARSKMMSLTELMETDWGDSALPIEQILPQAKQLLFILDGVDEPKWVLQDPNPEFCLHWREPLSVPALLGSLVGKTTLPGASFLITTRTMAIQKFIPSLAQPRWVEILGFSESGREEYFKKYFTDEKQALKAFSLVNSNSALLTLCLVPWVCGLVCACLKQQLEQGAEHPLTSQTTTALCLHFLSQAFPTQPQKSQLRNFCSLAAEGMWRRETMFTSDDITRRQLDVIVAKFLKLGILQKHSISLAYSFTHGCFQEFFAAVHFVLGDENVKREHPKCLKFMEKLLKEHGNHDLFQAPGLRFLFGLLSNQGAKEVKRIFSCSLPGTWKRQLLKWAQEKAPTQLPYSLDFFHCLYETQDEELLKLAMAHFQGSQMFIQTVVDLLVFTFCVKFCSHVKQLQLHDAGHHAQALWPPEVSLMFLMTVHVMLALKDQQTGFAIIRGPKWVFLLCRVGLEAERGLRGTMAAQEHLGSCGKWSLERMLREKLRISAASKESPAETPRQPETPGSTVRRLPYTGKEVQKELLKSDQSFEKGQEDQPETLRSTWSPLTNANWQVFFSTFGDTGHLRKLDLSGNPLNLSAVQCLCETLRQPLCRLKTLRLAGCGLTSSCCQELAALLSSSPSLVELDLQQNDLGNQGMQQLLEGLRHPSCHLTLLWLDYTFQSEEVSKELNALKKEKPQLQICSSWNLSMMISPENPNGTNMDNTSSLQQRSQSGTHHTEPLGGENDFWGPTGLVPTEIVDHERGLYRVHCLMKGFYQCFSMGLSFVVRRKVKIEIEFCAWERFLGDDEWRSTWMIAGPLLDLKAEPGAVAAVHLPHFVAVQRGCVDTSYFQVAHFKEEGMLLEKPSRVEPHHIVLENPSFSQMGILLRAIPPVRRFIPIKSTTLLYHKLHSEEVRLHLFLIPDDYTVRKVTLRTRAIDDEEKKFQFTPIRKPSPVDPLYIGSRYIVSSSQNLEIIPKELQLCYRSPRESQLFSEVYVHSFGSRIQLQIENKVEKTTVWKALLTPGDLKPAMTLVSPVSTALPLSSYAPSVTHFVDQYREQLVTRVTSVNSVLDKLHGQVLSEEQYESVRAEVTKPEQMRKLFSFSRSWGREYKCHFYQALKETHHSLIMCLWEDWGRRSQTLDS